MAVPLIPRLEAIGVRFEQGEIRSIDVAGAEVRCAASAISYDRLVLATGSQLARPAGALGAHGFDIDTLAGAAAFDRHLHGLAARPESEGRWTVVIAGGGFTGIELATALPERLRDIGGTAASSCDCRRSLRIVWEQVWATVRNAGHSRGAGCGGNRKAHGRYDCERRFGGRGVIEWGTHRVPDAGLDHGDAREPSGRRRFRRERMRSGGSR